MPPGCRPCSMRGFTLVETLVALALLAVALSSLGHLVIASRQSLEESLSFSRVQGQAGALAVTLQSLPPNHPWITATVVLESPAMNGLRLQGEVHPWPGASLLQLVEVNAAWRGGPERPRRFRILALRRAGGRP